MISEFFKVEILSPVHIGTGDTVDPFHYVIDEQKRCHFIDFAAWAADHPDPEELLKQFSAGNIAAMRNTLAEQVDPEAYAERSCRVISDKVVDDSRKHLDDALSKNQLLLAPNLVGGGGGPLLPGSSLKGAIRTAVIDWLDRSKNLQLKQCRTLRDQDKKLESFFGSITENSFQAFKIADCEAVCNSSLIVEAREVRRNPEKTITPKASCEVLTSRLLGEAEQAVLTTRIALGRAREKQAVISLKNGDTLDWLKLCELVNGYSRARYQKEQQKFWNLPHFARTQETLANIEQTIINPPPGAMVLKVGHYSQIEYVTVEHNQPKTRKSPKGGGFLPHGTTRTLANGIYPFGWVLLTPCSEEEYRRLFTEREAYNAQIRMKKDELREARLVATREKREAARRQREEKKRLKHEQEERAREEEEKPWLVAVRQLSHVEDWGSLRQLLGRELLEVNKEQSELAAAVLQTAQRVREKRPEKWGEERTEQINYWLSASGLQLKVAVEQAAEVLPEDCLQIAAFREFGDYQVAKIDPSDLSPQALRLLQGKMKEWGCDQRKVKKNKQQAYKTVLKHLQK
jgi:CRISPR type III-A-associated RAMP protein Csm5